MRHFFSLLTLAGLVGLLAVSCSKDDDNPIVVPTDPIVISENYFCFTGVSGDVAIVMNKYGDTAPAIQLQYSKDAKTWSDFVVDTTSVSVAAGEKAYFRAAPEAVHTALANASSSHRFTMTTGNNGQVDVGGNIMTLLGEQLANDNLSLDDYAFYSLFRDCTVLRRASALQLPAMTLAESCYGSMFEGCTGLEEAPALPAMTLALGCYYGMFEGCTSLEEAPALPATTLAEYCYCCMFVGCSSLVAAPVLPATTLARACYADMFNSCPLLGSVTMLATDVSADNALHKWLLNAGDNAFFTTDRTLTLAAATYADPAKRAIIQSETPDYWVLGTETVIPDISGEYLCFTGVCGEVAVSMNKCGDDAPAIQLQYSKDAKTWSDFVVGTSSVSVAAGEKAYFRAAPDAVHTTFATTMDAYNHFVITTSNSGQVDVSGNIMTLMNNPLVTKYNNTPYDYAFAALFRGCTCLRRASALVLPAMNLTTCCYSNMFYGCTGLEEAPALPATTLAEGCYFGMFDGCTGLEEAPALPATTLAERCYFGMFDGCTSLETAPILPATTLARLCYSNMFADCSCLVAAPALPATTLASWCYGFMFSDCTSLETAPVLPATTLASRCYASMFKGCTSLATAPALPATTLVEGCYKSMFWSCSSLETAPALPATTLAEGCYESMFIGCTSLETAPVLPATTLASWCYESMFWGCTNLETAPALPATTLAEGCYGSMFDGCTGLEEAPALPATTLVEACYEDMFIRCTNLSAVTMLATDVSATDCLSQWLQDAGIGSSVTSRTLTIAADTYADSEKRAVIEVASPGWTIAY